MKKFLAMLMALVMILSLVACGGSDTAEDTTDDTATEDTAGDYSDLQFGFLIPGSPTDGGFSQRCVEAAAYIEEQFPGCSTSVVQAATAEGIKQAGSEMAD